MASIQTVEKAIILSEYFMKNAMDIRTILVNPFQRNSKRVRDWYKSLPDQFKTQDAHQSGKENNLSESSIEKYLKREDVFEKVKQNTGNNTTRHISKNVTKPGQTIHKHPAHSSQLLNKRET